MEKKLLIDWLTFTIGIQCLLEIDEDDCLTCGKYAGSGFLQKICTILGADLKEIAFLEKRGYYGYETGYFCGGIRICYGGTDTVMVDLSGEGCRLLETIVPDLDWLVVIQRVSAYQRHNFSRLDIACDTFHELKMSDIFRYSLQSNYISRWKLPPRVVQGREETVDFGSPKSHTMLRIYNKTLERQCKAETDAEIPTGWVRCELQFRNDAVDSFLREWIACKDVSKVYFGIMANQLRFVRKRSKSETNLTRLTTVSWWRRFLENATPIRLLYKGGLEYNLQSLEQYLFGQAGSSLKSWLVLSDWNVDLLLEMSARRKMNERQTALIRTMETAHVIATGRTRMLSD